MRKDGSNRGKIPPLLLEQRATEALYYTFYAVRDAFTIYLLVVSVPVYRISVGISVGPFINKHCNTSKAVIIDQRNRGRQRVRTVVHDGYVDGADNQSSASHMVCCVLTNQDHGRQP